MKDVLIVCYGMGCGGAEKSLISFLNRLPKDRWNVDLIVANPNGMYMKQIPSTVHFLNNQYELENFATPMSLRRKKVCNGRDLINQASWQIKSRFLCKNLSWNEKRWELWGKHLPKLKKRYDLAISYMNGPTNYYVIDKVTAKKKILWIHNEYEKLSYNSEYDRAYFNKADRLVTISERCVKSLEKVFPECSSKIRMLYNISSTKMIWQLAEKNYPDEYRRKKNILVSIGRLNTQKGFDLAIQAAKIIEEKGVEFTWFIIGEGEDEQMLREQIKKERLDDSVKLVGIRKNPYPYIRYADVFVQPSRYEGKSIVLDEAKILCKPIVVTNYTTVVDSITDGVNGRIVQFDPNEIANGILELLNSDVQTKFETSLKGEIVKENLEVGNYIKLFMEMD